MSETFESATGSVTTRRRLVPGCCATRPAAPTVALRQRVAQASLRTATGAAAQAVTRTALRAVALPLSAAVLLLQSAPPAAAQDERRFDSLAVALDTEPVGTEPALHLHGPGKLVVQHVAEALVGHRNDMRIAPVLAESYAVSSDGLTWTFRLRRDIEFHNGAPLTADDVVWAWREYYLRPETNWHCRVYYDGSGSIVERTNGAEVTAVEAPASDTVIFRLARPSGLLLARMADPSCSPVIFHRDSLTADGRWRRLIGTGPYEVGEWRKGEWLRLHRFDGYRPRGGPRDGYAGERRAHADTIELRVFDDRRASLQALREGAVDVVLDVQEAERVLLEDSPGIELHTTSTINFWNLLLQTEDALLADRRVRRAIAHAIDLDYLAAVLTEGRQRANPSAISRNSHFHSTVHGRGHRFDPALARRLLEEAGYKGEPVEIQANRDGYPEMYRIGVLVRSMLSAVGIDARLSVLPWKAQLDDHYRTGEFQLQAFGQGGRNHPALVYGKFIGPKAMKARFQWDDEEAFEMVARAAATPDEAQQQRIFDALHLRMLEDVPTLPLLNFEYHDAVRDDVHGFETTPFMRALLWGVWKE